MRRLACALLIIQATAPTILAAQTPRPARRLDVTPELERSAFVDSLARTLLQRARAARVEQDSALRAYDAKTYLRLSIGMGVRRVGPDRLLMRTEQAARVRWARESGIWIEPTARRTNGRAPTPARRPRARDVKPSGCAVPPWTRLGSGC